MPLTFEFPYHQWIVRAFLKVAPVALAGSNAALVDVELLEHELNVVGGVSQLLTLIVQVRVRVEDFIQDTVAPSLSPTPRPTRIPTLTPTRDPTRAPTAPTRSPTHAPTAPTRSPTHAPTAPTRSPTHAPTAPTRSPTRAPTAPTRSPTRSPTNFGRRLATTKSTNDLVYDRMVDSYDAQKDELVENMNEEEEPQAEYSNGGYEVSDYYVQDTMFEPTAKPTARPSTCM